MACRTLSSSMDAPLRLTALLSSIAVQSVCRRTWRLADRWLLAVKAWTEQRAEAS